MAPPDLFADRTLAQRLERTEAEANRRFVEARARIMPDRGASWMEAGGAYALFDGVDSPLTQTFGLGMWEPVTPDVLHRVEQFFGERGAPALHELSPLADPSVLQVLPAHGYVPYEFSSVLYQALPRTPPTAPMTEVRVRLAHAEEQRSWSRASASGWSQFPELEAFMLDFGLVAAGAEGALPFLAELDGRIIATASMVIHDGVALLAGASTIPEARRRGAQAALLAARLADAVARGCDVAMMVASPGGGSQRNAERNRFRIAYTRTKWKSARA